ncbi:MAG: acyl carrier protein [Lacunisphaera sp.]|nr:acyl carrier protein [Lacunisphaera sp.]
MKSAFDDDPLLAQLRKLVARKFRFDESRVQRLTAEQPLFDGSLGLDSLDALEFGMQVEEEFGVTIDNAGEAREAFATLGHLAAYLRHHAPPLKANAPSRWQVPRPALS